MSGYTANIIAQRGTLNAGISFLQKPLARRLSPANCARFWRRRFIVTNDNEILLHVMGLSAVAFAASAQLGVELLPNGDCRG
jgi:hypothetical protein